MEEGKSYASMSVAVDAPSSSPLPSSPKKQDLKDQDLPSETSLHAGRRLFISYELFVWVIFGTWTALAVIDRFAWNVWPRDVYSIGTGNAGSDFIGEKFFQLKEGPWTVKLYDAVARASGRYCIVALNLIFFTMCHTTYAWLAETWVARHVIDMRDFVNANKRMHKWNGIGIVVMTLLHVWSILFPCIVHSYHAQVVLGKFEWILSERGPKGFKDADPVTQTMSLQGDDVFRIVEMTLLLAVLLPLTVRWLATKWHLGIHLHSLIAVLYFIDIVRRHTHPHSWILNTPFFVHWLADLAVGLYWRRNEPDIFRMELSPDYFLLFWDQPKQSDTVGPKYYLKLKESSLLERAHVFSTFENRRGLDLAGGRPWSVCILLRVYNKKRSPRLGKIDKISHTKRMLESTDLDIQTWGPFLGGMSDAVKLSLGSNGEGATLCAGGSAAGYTIDAVQQQIRGGKGWAPLKILYTTRDVALFHWVVNVISAVLAQAPHTNCDILVALTSGEASAEVGEAAVAEKRKEIDTMRTGRRASNAPASTVASTVASTAASTAASTVASTVVSSSEGDSGESDFDSSSGHGMKASLRLQQGRIKFDEEISSGSVVYFQGSGGLQTAVEKGVRANGGRLVAGPSYDNGDGEKSALLLKLKRAAQEKSCFNV